MAPEYYVFTGGERVPRHVTHVLIDKALKFVPARAFYAHPNIEELICHDGVEKIEEWAFYRCPSLRRVIMPGVKEVEEWAFGGCGALTYVECGKLERIGRAAFTRCESLSGVDLPSIKIVALEVFEGCIHLTNAKFGKDLESFGRGAFWGCNSLERITIPLKNGMITADDTFLYCEELNHIDLVEGAVLNDTINALHMEEWRNDMNEVIGAISQTLSNAHEDYWDKITGEVYKGGKARSIRSWIRSVLHQIVYYKAEHQRILNEATSTLQRALPNDIVFKNVLPFVELPSYTFQGED